VRERRSKLVYYWSYHVPKIIGGWDPGWDICSVWNTAYRVRWGIPLLKDSPWRSQSDKPQAKRTNSRNSAVWDWIMGRFHEKNPGSPFPCSSVQFQTSLSLRLRSLHGSNIVCLSLPSPTLGNLPRRSAPPVRGSGLAWVPVYWDPHQFHQEQGGRERDRHQRMRDAHQRGDWEVIFPLRDHPGGTWVHFPHRSLVFPGGCRRCAPTAGRSPVVRHRLIATVLWDAYLHIGAPGCAGRVRPLWVAGVVQDILCEMKPHFVSHNPHPVQYVAMPSGILISPRRYDWPDRTQL